MTDHPTPTPTREEKDWAFEWARQLVTWGNTLRTDDTNLARCHLHATAELARAEERIRYLKDGLFNAGLGRKVQELCPGAHRIICAALDQDDKLARSESEDTKMEPKFTPKPGDRVVVESSESLADQRCVGKAGVVLAKGRKSAPNVPPINWQVRFDDGSQAWLDEDAVFTPAPAPAEELDPGEALDLLNRPCPECGRPGVCPKDYCLPDRTQAEPPPAVASGVAAGEVTEVSLLEPFMGGPRNCVCGQPATNYHPLSDIGWCRRHSAPLSDIYNAGRAAVFAERSELERRVEELAKRVMPGAETLAASLEASQAEVAELKRELRQLGIDSDTTDRSRRATIATLRQELEAEKAAHEKTERQRRESNGWLSYLQESYLLGNPNAPGLTSEELVKRVSAELQAQKARAVPSVPELAPFIREGYFGVELRERGPWSSTTVEERADWINAAKRAISLFTGKVEASPPDNTPPEPSTDRARLEAEVAELRERLLEVEIQGDVTRRAYLEEGDFPGRRLRVERIEREERERAGK